MTTKRRSLPTKRAYIPQPEPEDDLIRRARRLPLSGPGIEVKIPLSLLPAYYELHGLAARTRDDLKKIDESQVRYCRRNGVVPVKRVRIKKGEPHGES